MSIIKFYSDNDVQYHPQAKLLGWALISKVFNSDLSENEITMLANGIDNITLESVLSLDSAMKKKRLLICAVLSQTAPASISDLYELVKKNEILSKEALLEIFLLSGDLGVIERCLSELNEAAIHQVLLNLGKLYLNELVKRGLLEPLDFCLNYSFLNRTRIKDFLTTTDIKNIKNFIGNAARNGHLAVIRHFEAQLSPDEKISAIKARDYSAIQLAALNGHLAVICHFEAQLSPDEKISVIKARNYSTIKLAARNGHLAVIRHFEAQLSPDEKISAIKARNYEAIREAAYKGHLAVIRHFEAQLSPDEKISAIKAGNYEAIQLAASYGHLAVIEHLLQYKQALSYVEHHSFERTSDYPQFLTPYISQQLRTLETARTDFESNNPNGVFDITPEDLNKYFIVLRHLIRRNQAEDIETINQLIAIPAIHQALHCGFVDREANGQLAAFSGLESTGDAENELLKVAQSVGNQNAARLLLTVPAVRERAEAAQFYQVDNAQINLAEIAQDRESSMRALTPAQKITFKKLQTHYQAALKDKGGVEGVFNLLIEALKARYNANPATLTLGDKTHALPLSFDGLQTFKRNHTLSDTQYQQALESYHTHQDHTVLRYLSKPNRWVDNRASYVYINDAHTERWSSFEEYKTEIAYFYLAAIDEVMPPTDDTSTPDRVNLFLRQLALIGRAHNWDKKNEAGREYDDIREGDKPSCYSGVNRRLYQSVLNHPLIVPFQEVLVQEIRTFVRASFKAVLDTLDKSALQQLQTDIDTAFIDVSTDGASFDSIKAFHISEEMQQKFIDDMTQKWGNELAPYVSSQMNQRFTLDAIFSTHLAKFYGEVQFDALISSNQELEEEGITPNSINIANTNTHGNIETEESSWLLFMFNNINRVEVYGASMIIGIALLALTSGDDLTATGITLATISVVGLTCRFFTPSIDGHTPVPDNAHQPVLVLY